MRFFIFAVVFVVHVFGTIGLVWLGGSLLASGIKAATNNCGSRYPIEEVLDGNLFCATDANK